MLNSRFRPRQSRWREGEAESLVSFGEGTCGVSVTLSNGDVLAVIDGTPEFFSQNPAGNFWLRWSGEILGEHPAEVIIGNVGRDTVAGCLDNVAAFVFTDDWIFSVTPTGHAECTCHANPSHHWRGGRSDRPRNATGRLGPDVLSA